MWCGDNGYVTDEHITYWNTDMSTLYVRCFANPPLTFNTRKVTDMSSMFSSRYVLNQYHSM